MYLAITLRAEPTPIREPLSLLPLEIGAWHGAVEPDFSEDIVAQLGVDEYIVRTYASDAAVVGLYEFTDAHRLKATPGTVIKMAFTWLPYQLVLSYAALRAFRRQLAGRGEWEKTQHIGAPRTSVGAIGEHTDVRTNEPATEVAKDGA